MKEYWNITSWNRRGHPMCELINQLNISCWRNDDELLNCHTKHEELFPVLFLNNFPQCGSCWNIWFLRKMDQNDLLWRTEFDNKLHWLFRVNFIISIVKLAVQWTCLAFYYISKMVTTFFSETSGFFLRTTRSYNSEDHTAQETRAAIQGYSNLPSPVFYNNSHWGLHDLMHTILSFTLHLVIRLETTE